MFESKDGKVYLLGAGPGSIDYLTCRAEALLSRADALVYDALVSSSLLQRLPTDCELWHVGKRGGRPSTSQTQINQLLVELCQQQKQVVRLKAGDPFVFGRAAAEIQALQAANCEFEVVPGLSSALVAPLLASIPLTDPVLSRGFGVFTAHDLDALNWGAIAHLQTIVFLMGGRQLKAICDRLLAQQKRPETPIAIIRWAGQPQQQIWQGTLLSIAQIVGPAKLSPCVIVIGEVVALRQYLSPQLNPSLGQPKPLSGKTILVTRAASQASQFSQMLMKKGAQVIDLPALEIREPKSWKEMDYAIMALRTFDWLVLTSPNAVNYFLDRLLHHGLDLRSLAHLKIAVVGKKTNGFLKQRGLAADFIPPSFVADSLVEHFPEAPIDKKLLFPRVEKGGRDVLVKEMSQRGAVVIEVAAYESACPDSIPPAAKLVLENGTVDAITFASSKTVRHFTQLMERTFGNEWLDRLNRVAIASIGPQTSRGCQQLLGRVTLEAKEYTLAGLIAGLEGWAKQQKQSTIE
ncbi:uroporphyrin-III C-methyltransferase domain protein [Synechococcus sp. PCC 7335]|uniref:uroporphyrinogen-III C-methyltransferase n=1 Tax=Synechococcus sp. (strain ATCC 29403 / PCC 7335) TaxID=91464 RepID=UPI00017EE813|nr:uroporphyrinogen-III C-methyltransferase [Synechococcus sp. PCC 7335]EDX84683.1 uroporphyrin-III C-methyltransferase domain protein [Synechococcus sp. PCC 7335]